ncbi:E3 ubiquitin-protein ligase At4g11680 [Cannabis sativa]|uniref:E3 ubiquitin-protein ligase At4g11680 n=1 Tax=Cannabis sativa TaxID=3483 RepID=UPI0029CA295E|nr:E3 ubiquitin-protein ligase At4g11680 [Cannabis sativa]
MDSAPLLGSSIGHNNLIRSRRVVRRTPFSLRRAARILRRASGSRMMLRESSVQVRENAAEELEQRQSGWARSKAIILLDVLWNLVFVVSGIAVLWLSMNEKPSVPLRLWVVGYMFQCLFHMGCVFAEHVPETEAFRSSRDWESSGNWSSSSGSDVEYSIEQSEADDNSSILKHLESANTMFSFVWWAVGFYWVTAGGGCLTRDSPQLYWLCITFLAFDMVFVILCVAIACLVGIAICCFLPCIIAILYVVSDQEGATEEEIDNLPKFTFRIMSDSEMVNGENKESIQGVMIECNTDSPTERQLSQEDAECCICLSAYDDEAEVRELPCRHHFHCSCIDKWLHINATCPLCKFNILNLNNNNESDRSHFNV